MQDITLAASGDRSERPPRGRIFPDAESLLVTIGNGGK
jgi:hypothetical protein